MILLHGFGATPRVWDRFAFAADRPALAGHGGPVPVDFETEVERLARRIHAPTTVVGYSLGGRLALGIACRFPEKVERLVLIGTHPGLDGPNTRLQRMAADDALAERLEREGLDPFFSDWDARPLFARRPTPDRDGLRADELAGAMRAFSLGRMPARWLQLPQLRMPVTWIAGELDDKFRRLAEQAARSCPRGETLNRRRGGPRRGGLSSRCRCRRARSRCRGSEGRMNVVQRWVLAARPATLTAAFVPVAVGSAVAEHAGAFRWGPALAALFGAFCIQIGTNFANDVFDHLKGADDEDRLGPLRVAQAGLITPRALFAGMAVAFGLATLAGLYLAWVGGWPIVAIGVASILSGIAYTGGPFPLGYNGLGDVFVMIFFGFVAVCGTAYVQVGAVPDLAWWASVPVGAIATAILVVNNVRDRKTDVRANKRTLVVRFGRAAGVAEYALLLLAAYAVPAWLAFQGSPYMLLPLLSAPWAIALFAQLRRREGASLNPTLASTAKLLLAHGVLFTVGLVLA